MEMRHYQQEARAAVHLEWAQGRKRTLLVLPTGTGKTIVFAKVVEDLARMGCRSLVLAHRGELLEQAADKIMRAAGISCALEKAESSSLDAYERVVVGSVQSLQRERRLKQFPRDHFDAIIVDEAHHVLSDSYRRILDHFDSANVLGVTATPDRGDMRGLGSFFDSLAYEYKLPQAIRDGYLCPIKAQMIPIKIDMNGVGVTAGDFNAGDIGHAIDPYLEQIAEQMSIHCAGRKTVVFLPLIATSQKMCALLRERGLRAAEVNGSSEDRAEVLRDFDAGHYDVICNSMLLTEGWDCPSVDCIVCLRPTKIRSLYCQIVGRGTRIHPGKSHLLLLDFLWLSERHELCRPAVLLAEDAESAAAATRRITDADGAMDLELALELGSEDAIKEREAALAKQLAEQRHKKAKLVDLLQYEMSIMDADLANYVPAFGWEMAPPSASQLAAIEKAGINPDAIECAGKASKLLDRLTKRRIAGLATPKQIRLLEQKGFAHVGSWSFDDASKMINRIAANGWRVPYYINPAVYTPGADHEGN
jgi:superfamily II DNA or RNA helicase